MEAAQVIFANLAPGAVALVRTGSGFATVTLPSGAALGTEVDQFRRLLAESRLSPE